MDDVGVVLAAAGQAKRMQGLLGVNKVYVELGGEPIINYSLKVFADFKEVGEMVVVTHPDECEYFLAEVLPRLGLAKKIKVVAGGKERQDSVRKGIWALNQDIKMVMIHDAARPFVSRELVRKVLREAKEWGAACPGIPCQDTLRLVDEKGYGQKVLDRKGVYRIQTPQAFRLHELKRAYEKAEEDGFLATDDATLYERYIGPVKVVAGEEKNIKITTPEDLSIARIYAGEKRSMRIGTGYDVHRLVEGRPLILGGVHIPYEKGLLGHSDADVLVHAICDALLGACALGDIGQHFPDNEPRYHNINSLVILNLVKEMLKKSNFHVINIDAVVIAEKPKLAPYISNMVKNLAETLEVSPDKVSVKATTSEGLGFCGRGEGIAAQAVALVVED